MERVHVKAQLTGIEHCLCSDGRQCIIAKCNSGGDKVWCFGRDGQRPEQLRHDMIAPTTA